MDVSVEPAASVFRLEAVSSETLTLCYQTTRCHVPQDRSVGTRSRPDSSTGLTIGLPTVGFAAASDRHRNMTLSIVVLKI